MRVILSPIGAPLLVLLLINSLTGTTAFSVSKGSCRSPLQVQQQTRHLFPRQHYPSFHSYAVSAASRSPLFSSRKPQPSSVRRHGSVWNKGSAILQKLNPAVRSLGLLRHQIQRSFAVLFMAALFWFGSASTNTQASHASTAAAVAPTAPSVERVVEKKASSLDKIVNRYIQNHMFDDDVYDPVESLYREAYHDATEGTYPKALREVTASVLAQGDVAKLVGVSDRSSGISSTTSNVGSLLTTAISLLQKQFGFTESTAIVVLASLFVIAGPSVFLFCGMVIGGMSKRNINRVMKQRYGETYTVDATVKKEEVVEAPEDEDDEDDDDDSEDDDDDDEDDEDKGKKS